MAKKTIPELREFVNKNMPSNSELLVKPFRTFFSYILDHLADVGDGLQLNKFLLKVFGTYDIDSINIQEILGTDEQELGGFIGNTILSYLIYVKGKLRELEESTDGRIQSVKPGTNITVDNTDPLNPIISATGGEEPLTEEFIVTAGAGAYDNGDLFPAGMTLAQAMKSLLTDTFYPTFVAPSFSLTNNSGLKEVGDTISLNLTGTFDRGQIRGAIVGTIWNTNSPQNPRAGLPESYTIDGTVYTTTALSQLKNIVNYVVPMGSSTFNGSVTYSVGPQPKDSAGANYSTPLPAGTLSNTTTLTGYLRRYAGPLSTIPTTGTEVRTALLGTSVLNTANSFTFTTGTVERIFAIAIPNTKNLVNVTNVGTNENLTSGFVLTGITTIPDAGGTNRSYKVYVMENAVPFSNNYTINVTLS